MDKKTNVVGYVKLAKLWERSEKSAIEYHNNYYKNKFSTNDTYNLFRVYIDITGKKETYKRTEMVKLLKDCQFGRVDCIFAQTKAYFAANTREFCYLIKFLFSMHHRIDIVTEDDAYNINTILNEDGQREALLKMADDFIYLNPSDYHDWLSELVKSINSVDNDQGE